MRTKALQIVTIAALPVLLFGFQNCSKLGTNGIAVSDSNLSMGSVEVHPVDTMPPSSSAGETQTDTSPATPSGGSQTEAPPASSSEEGQVETLPSVVDDDTTPAKDIDDSEVADAIKSCDKQGALFQLSTDLNLKFNHENVEVDADKVSSLSGNYGGFVLVRANQQSASADSIHVNHSTLVLCNFAKIGGIKGTFDKIIVVGGEIQNLQLNNSNLALVNSSVKNTKGAGTTIKHYSLK